MDPSQALKQQIGELIWNNAILAAELDKITKERDELKKTSKRKSK